MFRMCDMWKIVFKKNVHKYSTILINSQEHEKYPRLGIDFDEVSHREFCIHESRVSEVHARVAIHVREHVRACVMYKNTSSWGRDRACNRGT